jgi:hypothetical protein
MHACRKDTDHRESLIPRQAEKYHAVKRALAARAVVTETAG